MRRKMKVRLLDVCAVFVVAFLAWLVTFAMECYYHGVDSGAKQNFGHSRDHVPPFPGGSPENIFWFLQISDIHLSFVNDMEIAKDLEKFCTDIVSVIGPSLVLVTGDITHAKFADQLSSTQFEDEWRAYQRVLKKCKVRERLPWLDIRGNHDNFDVPSRFDSSNRFKDYSLSWKHHGSLSYAYIHNTSFGSYNFMAVDACPNPGPKRPFNFFGILHDEDLESLRRLSETSLSGAGPNHTIWITHYPSVTLTTNHRHLREIMSSAIAHVCGHLHTLANVVLQMYGHHPGGHLELELGDFVDSKRFRLLAIDHDLFSFADTSLNQWPLVLITNPKDAHFMVPAREPTKRVSHSTHVRVLAFSTQPITVVTVWVDGERLKDPPTLGTGPLFAVPWQPGKYSTGIHTIRVYVKDASGRETEMKQLFSLDGSIPPLQTLPQLLLLTDMRSLMRIGFLFLWLMLLSFLLLAWVNHSPSSFFFPLVQAKYIFFPLLITFTYFGLGPWFFGEVLTGEYGTVGVHGVKVKGHFIPGSMTYFHGIIHILLFHLPLTYYLNHVMSHDLYSGRVSRWRTCCSCLSFVLMLPLFLLQYLLYRHMLIPYGTVAVLISPGMTWVFLLAIVLIGLAFWSRTKRKRTRN